MVDMGFFHGMIMYLNCVFEVFLFYHYLNTWFPFYEEDKKIRILESGIFAALIFGINLVGNFYLNLLCIPLVLTFFSWLLFREKIKVLLFYVFFFYAMLCIVEFVCFHIYRALGISIAITEDSWIFRLAVEKICEFMILMQMIRKKHPYLSKDQFFSDLKSLFILPVSVLILLNGFLISDWYPYGYSVICLGGILIILSNIVNFFVVEKLIITENKVKNQEMMKLKTDLEHNHYQRMQEINEEYAGYIHEMKHIVQTMKQLVEEESHYGLRKLADEASELLKRKSPGSKKFYTHDAVLNAILIEREKEAQNRGICYEVQVQPDVQIDFISETDKIRIFGNLMDNAVKAAGECENGRLSASLYRGNESLVVFQISNNFKHQRKKRGGKYLTTKEDEARHGFGLQMVQELAEKYHGILNIEEERDQFKVVVILSNIQKTVKK